MSTKNLKHFRANFNSYDIFLYLKKSISIEKIKLCLFTLSEFIGGIVFYEYSNTINIRLKNDLSTHLKSIVFEIIVSTLDTCFRHNNAELLYLALAPDRKN